MKGKNPIQDAEVDALYLNRKPKAKLFNSIPKPIEELFTTQGLGSLTPGTSGRNIKSRINLKSSDGDVRKVIGRLSTGGVLDFSNKTKTVTIDIGKLAQKVRDELNATIIKIEPIGKNKIEVTFKEE